MSEPNTLPVGGRSLSRTQLRALVIGLMIAIVIALLVFSGNKGATARRNELVHDIRQDAAASANAGDPDQTRKLLRDQADEARAQQEVLAAARQSPANATAPALGAAPSVTPIVPGVSDAGLDRVDHYAQRKADVAAEQHAAQRLETRQRIAYFEPGDDANQNGDFAPQTSSKPKQSPSDPVAEQAALRQQMIAAAQQRMAAGGQGGAGGPSGTETPAGTPTVKGHQAWLQQQGTVSEQAALQVIPAESPFLLMQGSVIPCTLRVAVQSQLPGSGSCQVERDIYDSIRGRHKLVPKGTLALFNYQSEVNAGQSRLLAAFTRLIFPTGASIRLGAMPAAERSGASGIPAEVDNHFWSQFGSSLLVAGLSGLVGGDSSGNTQVVIEAGGGGSGLRSAAGQILVQTTKQMLEQNKTTQRTLSVNAGDRIAIVVTQDLLLPPSLTGGQP
ncbi:TrbI/VirB10 family protein [Parachitinimonas caeni]|uniref:TrbI/VirB10 family protein n=1 Tax=Parachitinimonas caeni TaxID=3031301 RepID=A0ABT7E1T7_9NEIS|nr:TrbI/VirB10 family protein [Parachitinimonas caeni]MDK2126270.1 TrbI/VirB10 family protein [Parachitinimonas caeni]